MYTMGLCRRQETQMCWSSSHTTISFCPSAICLWGVVGSWKGMQDGKGWLVDWFSASSARVQGIGLSLEMPSFSTIQFQCLLVYVSRRTIKGTVFDCWKCTFVWKTRWSATKTSTPRFFKRGTWKYTLDGETSTNHQFLGSMLVFGGVPVSCDDWQWYACLITKFYACGNELVLST